MVAGHPIIRCGACGLHYVDPVPTPEALRAIYDRSFFDVGRKFAGDVTGPGLVNARARVDAVGRLDGVGHDRWLDVGCATGDFLACAADRVTAVRGVELSADAAAAATRRGLAVTVGDFLDVAVDAGPWDVVSMWDYIEHVPDPAANLRKARALLTPGGYLALSTGNVDSRLARLTGRFWHLMIPPRHLYFFSPTTIRRLLADAGFEVTAIGTPGKRVPLDFIAWKAAWLVSSRLALPVLRASGRLGLGRFVPRVNLRDIMTLYARARDV